MANSLKQLADILSVETARLSGDPRRLQVALEENRANKLLAEKEERRQGLTQWVDSLENTPLETRNLLKTLPEESLYAYFLKTAMPSEQGPIQWQVLDKNGEPIAALTDEEAKQIKDSIYAAGGQLAKISSPTQIRERGQASNAGKTFEVFKTKLDSHTTLFNALQGAANKLAESPEAALTGVGTVAQAIDGVVQSVDAFGDILSGQKNQDPYANTFKTFESEKAGLKNTKFFDRIMQVSEDFGVSESRIRDLAYLFAAARGQEGRGLSDKDYENALAIVSGGVGATGRIAVIEDIYTRLLDDIQLQLQGQVEFSQNLLNQGIQTETQEELLGYYNAYPQFKAFINPLEAIKSRTQNDAMGVPGPGASVEQIQAYYQQQGKI